MKLSACTAILIISLVFGTQAHSQTITGAWKGKIGSIRTELKLVKKGDSLMGTSYYYSGKNNYRRYSIKGYFDPETNNVIWWDDVLLEEKGNGAGFSHKEPFLSVADFNCPGENKMLLEGKSSDKNDMDEQTGPVQMEKALGSSFPDEWDYVLDNYFVGANHPDVIDSVAGIAFVQPPVPDGFEGTLTPPIVRTDPSLKSARIPATSPVATPTPQIKTPPAAEQSPVGITDPVKSPESNTKKSPVQSLEQKFAGRTNKLQTVIPVTAEKIELRFYDNAQVDGDSIALFLNGRMLFKNIRLTEQSYTVMLNASDLGDDNELVMVAENLGSIPPNTSFMVAIVGDKRYEARLYANENSSALIRFVKQ
ncbi:MAG: hypothetical protein EOO04_21620 [Chitinophagaceae bacterium]|nr:MAG: hypothetical protein EOO04_21620 [Chitinophagaceae bacterium]